VRNPSDICFSHVFFCDPDSDNLDYWTSMCCQWSQISSQIRDKLRASDKGTFGITIGILNEAGSFPSMVPMDEFFGSDNAFHAGRSGMILVISSFRHCK